MSRPYKPVRMVTDQQLSTEGASTEQPRVEIRHRQPSTKNRNSHANKQRAVEPSISAKRSKKKRPKKLRKDHNSNDIEYTGSVTANVPDSQRQEREEALRLAAQHTTALQENKCKMRHVERSSTRSSLKSLSRSPDSKKRTDVGSSNEADKPSPRQFEGVHRDLTLQASGQDIKNEKSFVMQQPTAVELEDSNTSVSTLSSLEGALVDSQDSSDADTTHAASDSQSEQSKLAENSLSGLLAHMRASQLQNDTTSVESVARPARGRGRLMQQRRQLNDPAYLPLDYVNMSPIQQTAEAGLQFCPPPLPPSLPPSQAGGNFDCSASSAWRQTPSPDANSVLMWQQASHAPVHGAQPTLPMPTWLPVEQFTRSISPLMRPASPLLPSPPLLQPATSLPSQADPQYPQHRAPFPRDPRSRYMHSTQPPRHPVQPTVRPYRPRELYQPSPNQQAPQYGVSSWGASLYTPSCSQPQMSTDSPAVDWWQKPLSTGSKLPIYSDVRDVASDRRPDKVLVYCKEEDEEEQLSSQISDANNHLRQFFEQTHSNSYATPQMNCFRSEPESDDNLGLMVNVDWPYFEDVSQRKIRVKPKVEIVDADKMPELVDSEEIDLFYEHQVIIDGLNLSVTEKECATFDDESCKKIQSSNMFAAESKNQVAGDLDLDQMQSTLLEHKHGENLFDSIGRILHPEYSDSPVACNQAQEPLFQAVMDHYKQPSPRKQSSKEKMRQRYHITSAEENTYKDQSVTPANTSVSSSQENVLVVENSDNESNADDCCCDDSVGLLNGSEVKLDVTECAGLTPVEYKQGPKIVWRRTYKNHVPIEAGDQSLPSRRYLATPQKMNVFAMTPSPDLARGNVKRQCGTGRGISLALLGKNSPSAPGINSSRDSLKFSYSTSSPHSSSDSDWPSLGREMPRPKQESSGTRRSRSGTWLSSPATKPPSSDWMERFNATFGGMSHINFVDSHCHIDMLFDRIKFNGTYAEYRELNKLTFPRNYEGCVTVFCKPKVLRMEVVQRVLAEGNVWGAVGLHPKDAQTWNPTLEYKMRALLTLDKVVAAGEMGLDYSQGYFFGFAEQQKVVFERQLQIAVELKKPIVIHCRDAEADCIEIVSRVVPRTTRIHRHCFTGTWSECQTWLDRFPNSFVGLTACVTYASNTSSNSINARDVARYIPLDRLLLETDAPYFVPESVPRDECNYSHPGMIITVAAAIATIRDIEIDVVLTKCRENTFLMYGV